MINKKEFDLLLQEIFQIESKIEEMKILNRFDKATEYNDSLEKIKEKANGIILDNENNSEGFDSISLEVLKELIKLNSDVDYYVLRANNVIASITENMIDAEALNKIKKMWEDLDLDIKAWEKTEHNPIEEIEHNKQIGKATLDIIIYRLQVEAVIDFTEVFKNCKKEFLINAIKEVLFEGAKNEQDDRLRRQMLIDLAKKMAEKDLYDYKLWQQIMAIKEVRSRDDHIEIMGNLLEKDNRKYVIEEKKPLINLEEIQNLDIYNEVSILKRLKEWIVTFKEKSNHRKMELSWRTSSGPAFKAELIDGTTKFCVDLLDKTTIEKVKKLTIASNGIAKYNFEKNAEFKELEEVEFPDERAISCVALSPDRTYKCIGNESFADCEKLKKISFGKIEMIGEMAFKNCRNLSSLVFNKELKNIGENAFMNCESITRVEFLGELNTYILDRPQNIINCFKGTNLEEIVFPTIDSTFNFAITDCPHLKRILVSNIPSIEIPFEICKYRLGREEGIVTFVGEKALNLWKKKNANVRFFELTDEDRKRYDIV